eukprot:129502-Pyramimonas_sp.AAC.1
MCIRDRFGQAKGRSRTIGFMLSPTPQADPAHVANSAPLMSWANAVHLGWAPHGAMKVVFE